METELNTFFKDLVVIELASVLAGPAVGSFFSELGAQVIKIENKKSKGDVTRTWKDPQEKQGVSAYYSSVNYRKEVIYANLSEEDDRERVYNLIKTADLVISNFKPESASKLGFDYPQLKRINPAIIVGNISGFASSTRPAYDAVLQAETGYMSMNGQPDSPPTKLPIAFIDVLAAHQMKQALLLAIIKKNRTGKGCLLETSLEETSIASMVNQSSNYLMNGVIAKRKGSLHPNIAPYGEIIQSHDDWQFALSIGNDQQFRRLCEILSIEIYESPKFKTNIDRVVNREEMIVLLNAASKKMDGKDLYDSMLEANIPVGKIKQLDEVLETNLAKSMVLEEEIDGAKTKRIKSVAFKMTD